MIAAAEKEKKLRQNQENEANLLQHSPAARVRARRRRRPTDVPPYCFDSSSSVPVAAPPPPPLHINSRYKTGLVFITCVLHFSCFIFSSFIAVEDQIKIHRVCCNLRLPQVQALNSFTQVQRVAVEGHAQLEGENHGSERLREGAEQRSSA